MAALARAAATARAAVLTDAGRAANDFTAAADLDAAVLDAAVLDAAVLDAAALDAAVLGAATLPLYPFAVFDAPGATRAAGFAATPGLVLAAFTVALGDLATVAFTPLATFAGLVGPLRVARDIAGALRVVFLAALPAGLRFRDIAIAAFLVLLRRTSDPAVEALRTRVNQTGLSWLPADCAWQVVPSTPVVQAAGSVPLDVMHINAANRCTPCPAPAECVASKAGTKLQVLTQTPRRVALDPRAKPP